MNLFRTIGAIFECLDRQRGGRDSLPGFDRIVSPRVVRLVEADDGGFAVEAAGKAENIPARIGFRDGTLSAPNLAPLFRGSRVEIVLQPKRFLFRPLEFPARAADFLEGIVRAQIDRLTPWSASEAVFGCSAPVASGAESITTMIAATTRKVAMSYVQAVSGFHPASIAICTDVGERDAGRVKVFEQKARGHLDAARLSRALLIGLGAIAAAAVVSVAVGVLCGGSSRYPGGRTGAADFGAARRHSRRQRRRRSLADRSA